MIADVWRTISGWFDGADWGTIPDWFAAVATVAAVAAALWLASMERRRRELADARAAARTLSVSANSGPARDETGQVVRGHNVVISNPYERPFHKIRIEFSDPRLGATVIDRVRAGGRIERRVGNTSIERDGEVTDYSLTLTFRDDSGHRWMRDSEYVLRRELPRRPWRWRRRFD